MKERNSYGKIMKRNWILAIGIISALSITEETRRGRRKAVHKPQAMNLRHRMPQARAEMQ